MRSMIFVFCIMLAFFLGYWLRTPAMHSDLANHASKAQTVLQTAGFTCSMHLQIRQSKAGKLDERYESSLAFSKDLDAARKCFENITKRFYREISASSENLKSSI